MIIEYVTMTHYVINTRVPIYTTKLAFSYDACVSIVLSGYLPVLDFT